VLNTIILSSCFADSTSHNQVNIHLFYRALQRIKYWKEIFRMEFFQEMIHLLIFLYSAWNDQKESYNDKNKKTCIVTVEKE